MTGVLVALLLGSAAIETARAQAPYPSRPIRIVVPFGPGGFADITVRLVGQKLAERTSQQVVIENRPSAGGIIAANAVTSAQSDGYTLFVFSSGIALSKALLKTMPFDPATAFTSISTMALFDLLLLVKTDSPMQTLKDALDTARADPSKFNVGTINPGSTQNVTAELLPLSDQHPDDHRAPSHLRRGADLALAQRHPDRRGVLRGAEVADRRQADPRYRRKRQQALTDAAQCADL